MRKYLTLGTAAALFVTVSAASAQLKPAACLDLTISLPDQTVGIHPHPNGQCVMKIVQSHWCKVIDLNAIGNFIEYSRENGYFIMIDPFSTDQARPCE